MADDWRNRQIVQRLEEIAQDVGCDVSQVASIKIRPQRYAKSGFEQAYLDGDEYHEVRGHLKAMHSQSKKGRHALPNGLLIEEHETGPELLIQYSQIGLDVINTIVAFASFVIVLLDRRKSAKGEKSSKPEVDQVSLSIRTVKNGSLVETEITAVAPGTDITKVAREAKKVASALQKAAK